MTWLRWRPFPRPRDHVARLPMLAVAGIGLLLLSLWDPVARPGPVVCLLRRVAGIPCPLCGATRGVALCLRGQPMAASLYNPLSLPLLLGAVFLVLLWVVEYVTRHRLEVHLPGPVRRLVLALVPLVLTATWVYLLVHRREDPFARSWLGRLLDLFW